MIRVLGVGAPIAIGLVVLAAAVGRHDLSATDAGAGLAAVDFTVTSERDAGPQSLRDAILAADRLSGRAHVIIAVKRIAIEAALPALINPRGIDLQATAGNGLIDASQVRTGAVLQIDSPTASVKGLDIVGARSVGVVVNAAAVRLDSLTVSDSDIGVLVHPAGRGCGIDTSTFQRDGTGVMVEPGSRDVSVLSSIFETNRRAGIWFVGSTPSAGTQASATADASATAPAVRVLDSVFDRDPSGVVIANQAMLIQKSRFLGSSDSSVLVLGGSVRLEDSEIRGSRGTAVSVNSGRDVAVVRDTLIDNPLTAIMVRDSDAIIEHNTLTHNGLGIVAISARGTHPAQISDNVITGSAADALTVIGGAPLIQRNRVLDNRGAGLRVLDLLAGRERFEATPQLQGNVFQGNGSDVPAHGTYQLSGPR